jgi:hypothetical protein
MVLRPFEGFEHYFSNVPSNLSDAQSAQLIYDYIDDKGVQHAQNYQDFLTYMESHKTKREVLDGKSIQRKLSTIWYPSPSTFAPASDRTNKNFVQDLFRTYEHRQQVLSSALLYMKELEEQLSKTLVENLPTNSPAGKVAVIRALNDTSFNQLFDHNDDFGKLLRTSTSASSAQKNFDTRTVAEFGSLKAAHANFKNITASSVKRLHNELKSIKDPGMKEKYKSLLTDLCFSAVNFGDTKGYKEQCKDLTLGKAPKSLRYEDFLKLNEPEQICAVRDFR